MLPFSWILQYLFTVDDTRSFCSFFMGNADEAKELLAKALLRFPTVLKPLLEKIAVNTSSRECFLLQQVLNSKLTHYVSLCDFISDLEADPFEPRVCEREDPE
jgi:hypothetical protein